ncbi:MAG: hypothetical protein AAGH65_09850, partial [Pseudomonadota bacterium]
DPSWRKTAGLRMLLVVVLIGVLTPFWIYLLFFTKVPMLIMATIALVILLLFSTATAWTAIAIPQEESESDDSDADDGPTSKGF